MALICCPECGKAVSDKAAMCPHCGVSLKKKKAEVSKIGLIMGIISVPLGVFLLICNIYWIAYALFLILLGIINIVFYKNSTYLIVAGMLYVTGALFTFITIPVPSGRYFVFVIYVIYAFIFLWQAFKKRGNI